MPRYGVYTDVNAASADLEARLAAITAALPTGQSVYNVKASAYAAVGDGTADDTAAIQAAINAVPSTGGVIYFPAGTYKVSSTLSIQRRGLRFVGVRDGRVTQGGGSRIAFSGTNACFKIGTSKISDTTLYDASYGNADYDGYGETYFDDLSIEYTGSGTSALGNGQGSYGTNTIAIQDWRGGAVRLHRVWIEKFHYGFWGIQSDFDAFHEVDMLYCKVGSYLGPRTDQFRQTNGQYSLCDTALWLDACSNPTFLGLTIVGCGSATTAPIKILSQYTTGTKDAVFGVGSWFERLQGYVGTVPAFVEIGKAGAVTEGPILFENPFINVKNATNITSYFAEIDQASVVKFRDTAGSYNLLAKFVNFTGTGSPKVEFSDLNDVQAVSYVSTSTGTPQFNVMAPRYYVQPQKSSNVTLTANDSGVVPISASGGNVVVTLPLASTMPNRRFLIKRSDSSANTVTVTAAGADTIDGTATVTIPALGGMEITPNFPMSAWLIVSRNLARSAANADTSGATLTQLETEVNELKAALRLAGILS